MAVAFAVSLAWRGKREGSDGGGPAVSSFVASGLQTEGWRTRLKQSFCRETRRREGGNSGNKPQSHLGGGGELFLRNTFLTSIMDKKLIK